MTPILYQLVQRMREKSHEGLDDLNGDDDEAPKMVEHKH